MKSLDVNFILITPNQNYIEVLTKIAGGSRDVYFDYVEFNGGPSFDLLYSKKLSQLKQVHHSQLCFIGLLIVL